MHRYNFPGRRAKRRKEASERAELRAKRSPEQQIAKLDMGGHSATKERARLEKQIENSASG